MDYREESIRIGSLRRPWGHKGELMAELLAHEPEDLLPTGFLFIEFDGQLVPFKYLSIRETGKQGVLFLFEEYDTPEKAALLQGRELHAPPRTIVNEKRSAIADEDLIGVQVIDTDFGEIGSVIRVEGSEKQSVMVILKGVKEVMVPLAEDLINSYDPDSRILNVSTPPGLIDMYLS